MLHRTWLSAVVLPIVSLLTPLCAQEAAAWRDPSPHRVQFVTVDENVRLEVLDWGGSGRPVVLLSGLGNTAHVFDEFAPKLTADYHVYGFTRRGFGASSVPASGYTADRLGDDVLAVLDSLKLTSPVLVGHSVAGRELSSVGSRHPERIAGLVYLEALYSYAYATPQEMGFWRNVEELQKNLQELQKRGPADAMGLPAMEQVQELLQKKLPEVQGKLQEFQRLRPPTAPAGVSRSAADLESFAALRSWYTRVAGYIPPEAELRQIYDSSPDGHVGKPRTPSSVPQAIRAVQQKYTDIQVPALAIVAVPHAAAPWMNDPAVRALAEEYSAKNVALTEARAKAFESAVANARVVRLPHASHYVFLSNEADVLREMRAFLESLK
jgi:non-heme chloroperoxidase